MPQLDEHQQQAIDEFRKHKLLIITGGPGRGKTHVIKTICEILEANNHSYALCAPTGKAAKRMEELTKRKASTIHRLLNAGFGRWKYNKYNKLTTIQYVVVDETSMLDLEIVWHLLQAFPSHTHFVFVGDIDQLPSIGAGTVLRDLVRSGKVPTYYLKINHRQGKGSLIAENATYINEGKLVLTFDEDLRFIECENPIIIREHIDECIDELQSDGYNLISECQVLTPQHKTRIGVKDLNDMLRFKINKHAKPTEKFSVGDKVMQTVNNYNLGIFNGYVGQIISNDYYTLKIKFFDGTEDDEVTYVDYPKTGLSELMLAYACTIHKYQGSESLAGVLVVSNSHHYMWTRNLLYTAITRFKEKCIIIGDSGTLRKAITNSTEQKRNSKLMDRIQGRLENILL